MKSWKSVAAAGLLVLAGVVLAQAQDDDAWKKEMERKIDLLTQELEKGKLGEVATPPVYESKHGFGPGASKVYNINHGVSIGGYGEMLYQDYASKTDDGSSADRKTELDFLRAVMYFGYKFTDKILFNSEIEFEHAIAGGSGRGEVEMEFAYLDFMANEHVGARTGLMLMPIGLTNEYHEPTMFHGAKRTVTETNIIPTTWRENGAGIFGDAGPFSYRAYIVAGLQSSSSTSAGVNGFSSTGIRSGRSNGARSVAEDLAAVARLDYKGIPGTLLGGSYYTGNAGQDVVLNGEELDVHVQLWELHGMTEFKGLEMKALYAQTRIGDVAELNTVQNRAANASTGEKQFGGYAEIAFDVLSLTESTQSFYPFVRYERVDTQQEVPSGYTKNPANSQTILTYGLTYRPIQNTVFKADYQNIDNGAGTGVDQFNAAVGYMF